MSTSVSNGATVERTALYVKRFSGGDDTYIRVPFDIEVRTDSNGRQTFIAFNYGDELRTDQEEYDDVKFYDIYPTTWPRIGFES